MTFAEVPQAAPRSRPCAALADFACRRGVRNERDRDGGSAHRRAPLRPLHASALLLLLPLGPAAVHAEPAGRMGPTSRAAVQISLSVAPRLEVSRSSVEGDGSSGAAGSQSFCVWSNSGVGSYSISASDASERSAGEAAAAEPAFAVQLAGVGPGAVPLALAPGATATGLAAASAPGCGSGRLVVRPATMAGGDAPAQSGALLLLVAPD